jgi:drug/metabolite transporter superfamily protein YnfA
MSRTLSLIVLLFAAILEAGGDALIRAALHSSTGTARFALFAVGAVVLFSYGYFVNRPPWEFGRLLGIYVVFFFLVAQAMSWVLFNQPPTGPVVVGGAFVIAGGVIMSAF